MNRTAEIKIFKIRFENIFKDLNNLIQKLKSECDRYQEGRLYIKYRGDKVHFVEYRNGKQIGISKNQERIYELSRLEYLNSTIKLLEKLSDKTQEVISKMDSDNYEDTLLHIMEKYKMLDFNRICFPYEKLQWDEASYNKNPYRTEFLRYGTKKGINMRSKSERTIGNKLEEWNIPYRYEAAIKIDGKIFYPDFTILKESGEIVLWEHMGLMDNEEYSLKAIMKINFYRKAGFKLHRNLICTWEEDIEKMDTLDEIIMKYIFM